MLVHIISRFRCLHRYSLMLLALANEHNEDRIELRQTSKALCTVIGVKLKFIPNVNH